jgi:hypothetical protein
MTHDEGCTTGLTRSGSCSKPGCLCSCHNVPADPRRTREKRPFDLTKQDAATFYEGVTVLQMMLAKAERKKHPTAFPYNDESLLELGNRLLATWPELRPLYRGPDDD